MHGAHCSTTTPIFYAARCVAHHASRRRKPPPRRNARPRLFKPRRRSPRSRRSRRQVKSTIFAAFGAATLPQQHQSWLLTAAHPRCRSLRCRLLRSPCTPLQRQLICQHQLRAAHTNGAADHPPMHALHWPLTNSQPPAAVSPRTPSLWTSSSTCCANILRVSLDPIVIRCYYS